jgi:hypothetical protein
VSSKKRQQTFAKMKREQLVKERRERKQEAKRAARTLKVAARLGEGGGELPVETRADANE